MFLNRIKYEIGHFDFNAKSISKEYGNGDKVVELYNKRDINDLIKIDGPAKIMEEI